MKACWQKLALGLSLLAVFGISMPVLAQETTDESAETESLPATSSFGVVLGLTLSAFSGADSDGLDGRIGFLIGGRFFRGTENFGFQTGLQYAQRGASMEMGSADVGINLNYLEIPALFKFRNVIAFNDNATRYLYLGPIIGINVGSSLSVKGGGASASVDIDNAKTINLGLAFGADAAWKIGKTTDFLLDVRFTWGLTNAFDDGSGSGDFAQESGEAFELKNYSLDLSVGVGF